MTKESLALALVIMGFCLIGIATYFVGYGDGRSDQDQKWIQSIDQMKIDCQYAPQPVKFPNDSIYLIRIYSIHGYE